MNRHFKFDGRPAIFALSCLLSFVADADPLERSSRWRNSEKTGKLVIPAVFDQVLHFADDDDRAAVVKDGKFGWINKEGQLVIPAQFDGGGNFTDGLAPAKVGGEHGSYGYIDRTGKFVIPPQFKFAFSFSEGKARVEYFGEPWAGYIDKLGNPVMSAESFNIGPPYVVKSEIGSDINPHSPDDAII